MIIVIDGYNLIKNIRPVKEVTEQERRQFLAVLGKYAQRKKHTLIVVFDGGPYEWVYSETISGIQVLYSGRRENADEVIVRYLAAQGAKEMLLVSSDHEVCLAASGFDVPSIGSTDFYALVREALSKTSDYKEPEIEIDDQMHDLDSLMHEAGKLASPKQDDIERTRQTKYGTQQVSKKDRALMQRLKKL